MIWNDPLPAGTEPSIQQQLYPELPCFGCGPANPDGLRLSSYAVGGLAAALRSHEPAQVRASFTPWPAHNNGLGYLNGGIIATVLDCHSGAVVVLEATRQGWPTLAGARLPHVTAGLAVRYLRPSPLTETVELIGEVSTASEAEITAHVQLRWDGKVRAEADALWKRWRPR